MVPNDNNRSDNSGRSQSDGKLDTGGSGPSADASAKGGVDMQEKISEHSSPNGAPTTWVVRPDPDLEDLIPSFMQNRKNELADLEQAMSRNDFDAVRRMAHTWKGICRPYGFVHLETLSRNLEDAGEREVSGDVNGILVEIKDYLANVRIVYDS